LTEVDFGTSRDARGSWLITDPSGTTGSFASVRRPTVRPAARIVWMAVVSG